ncbi:aldehyde reductase [bacterium AH-315-P15]|nr:aldehyde reductase [bacterium AH-315-P15]
MTDKVLVTGASGFIASHCIIQLLEKGYTVRGTLRTMGRADAIRDIVGAHTDKVGNLEFAEADLSKDAGWAEAADGCPLILHVASPFPLENPKDEDDLIIPAREGTLRVLRAAKDTGARKVVQTSSVAAMAYGHRKQPQRPFDETDWSNPKGPNIEPYAKSKTLAEREAWNFVKKKNPPFGFAVVNPGAVLGPVLESDYGTSAEIVLRILQGSLPGMPKLGFPIVDVRDVAGLHILALESDASNGQRFPCVSGFMWFSEIGAVLRANFPEFEKKIPKRELPNFVMHIAALFGQFPRSALSELGQKREVSSKNAATRLGWQPRSAEEAVIAAAQSLIDQGIVKP